MLQGKVAIVTGAANGIGEGIAERFASEGAAVVLADVDAEAGARAAARIAEGGGRALFIETDVSSSAAVNALVQAARERWGRIDTLVNNAGIAIWKPFFDVTEEMWDAQLDINLKGVFLCSQAVARMMRDAGGGSIINISSTAAHAALMCLAPYCASKGGMTLLTREMALELAPYRIRVNAIAPGTVRVERNLREDPDYPDNWMPFIPWKRVGEVEDIAALAAFLASDPAEYITGQTIYVDGGLTSYVPIPTPKFAMEEGIGNGE